MQSDEGGDHVERRIGLLRESMDVNVLVVAQWVGQGRDGLIP